MKNETKVREKKIEIEKKSERKKKFSGASYIHHCIYLMYIFKVKKNNNKRFKSWIVCFSHQIVSYFFSLFRAGVFNIFFFFFEFHHLSLFIFCCLTNFYSIVIPVIWVSAVPSSSSSSSKTFSYVMWNFVLIVAQSSFFFTAFLNNFFRFFFVIKSMMIMSDLWLLLFFLHWKFDWKKTYNSLNEMKIFFCFLFSWWLHCVFIDLM